MYCRASPGHPPLQLLVTAQSITCCSDSVGGLLTAVAMAVAASRAPIGANAQQEAGEHQAEVEAQERGVLLRVKRNPPQDFWSFTGQGTTWEPLRVPNSVAQLMLVVMVQLSSPLRRRS